MLCVVYNTHKYEHDSTWFVFTTIQWYHYQRKKLLYDESWIIDFDKIEREVGYRGQLITGLPYISKDIEVIIYIKAMNVIMECKHPVDIKVH